MSLSNKTALITGASRGLGLHIAKQLWHEGANLILLARSHDKLEQIKNELLATAQKQQTIKLLVADLADQTVVETISQRAGHVDILINNAAVQGPIGLFWQNDWQAWQDSIQINLFAPTYLCRAFLPGMISQGYGKIINLSGGGATNVRQNFTAYAVGKVGIVRFSEILAHEVKPYHIDVNCIAPGVMNTELLAQIVQAGPEKSGQTEYANALKQMETGDATAKRAAELCAYLAAPVSDGITGRLISAVWDPWPALHKHAAELAETDIYTLRRIVPEDRNKNWK